MTAVLTQTPSHLSERLFLTMTTFRIFLMQRKKTFSLATILATRRNTDHTCGNQFDAFDDLSASRCSIRPKARARERDLENIDVSLEKACSLPLRFADEQYAEVFFGKSKGGKSKGCGHSKGKRPTQMPTATHLLNFQIGRRELHEMDMPTLVQNS